MNNWPASIPVCALVGSTPPVGATSQAIQKMVVVTIMEVVVTIMEVIVTMMEVVVVGVRMWIVIGM